MKSFLIAVALSLFCMPTFGQVPIGINIQILKAEDARRYSPELQNLMHHADAAVRSRAALAAGRIGNDAAMATLEKLLHTDRSLDVQAMAAFAIGEIESPKGSAAILKVLGNRQIPGLVRARAVEAAGKIAAVNSSDPSNKPLGAAILDTLNRHARESNVVLLAITAALRARPEGADRIVARFLSSPDARIRADAANTLSRIRAKNANPELRKMLTNDRDPIARANAARALGAAEDRDSVDLLAAASKDSDIRVRVSAIRSLATLREKKAVDALLERGATLTQAYRSTKKPNYIPIEKSEFLEIATALGRILEKSGDARAVKLLSEFRKLDGYESTEVAAAFAAIAPKDFFAAVPDRETSVAPWKQFRATAAGMSQLAKLDDKGGSLRIGDETPEKAVRTFVEILSREDMKTVGLLALPDVLRTYAEFKTGDLEAILRERLASEDVFVRATAAELLAANFASPATRRALVNAFEKALTTDKNDNDAQLALLDAMVKADSAGAVDTIYKALDSPDFLVRKRALALLNDPKLLAAYPGAANVARDAQARHKDTVWPYDAKSGTRLGQVLNRDSDYRRALSRKNGSIRAVFITQKGKFTMHLLPEDAPLTVDNFVKLARSRYFDGLEVHRVVPNFVMQDGDPLGNGSGGPGWSIRCEVNMVPYDRGAVGMALSGKDTGGSQWFVTHSPQPHLDGGYTVFGRVNSSDIKVVDNIVRGDKILRVSIVDAASTPARGRRSRK